jgi:hypothetical protein
MLDDLAKSECGVDATTQYRVDVEERHLLFQRVDIEMDDLGAIGGFALRVDPWHIAIDY